MPGKMLSSFVMMALMGIAAGTPHPECEPCAAVAKAELDALDMNGKYLCCDLTCAETPVAGCGIFGLPLVCKACYDGDGTPAYDDDPVDDDGTTPSTTPAPATAAPVTAQPVTAAPVTPVTAPTPEMPVAAPTPEPVMPVMPVTPPTPEPVMPVAGPTPEPEPDMSMSYDFDDCSPCEEATEMLTMEDWIALENDGLELVCDPDCYENSMLDGCGAFGLDTECRAVEIDGGEGEGGGEGGGTTSSETGAGGGGGGGTTSSETGAGGGGGGGTTSSQTGEGGGEGGGTTSSETGEGGGAGGGTTSSETGAGGGGGGGTTSSETGAGGGGGGGTTSSQTGEGGGEGGGTTSSETGAGGGEGGGGDDTSGSCTEAEIAMCADISPAQEEALTMYAGGEKVIVCDPTCLGEDISHCNYFGLGQLCRGCGSCSDCVPCP
ncbi:unnamed protein product [Ectocarpus sp. 6 AP-2014]